MEKWRRSWHKLARKGESFWVFTLQITTVLQLITWLKKGNAKVGDVVWAHEEWTKCCLGQVVFHSSWQLVSG